jgi:hypothetical protein
MDCNFFSNDFFSIGFLHRVRVENGKKKLEEIFEFFHKMAPLAQGVGQNWFFYHNFNSIQLFFNLFFALDLHYQYAWVVSPGMSLIEPKF